MVQRMRRACGLAAEALQLAQQVAQRGVTTDEAGPYHAYPWNQQINHNWPYHRNQCSDHQVNQNCAEVDRVVSEFVISRNAYPVGINYYGFPRGLCASPNEVALHGVPNTRPLEEGDIVNFDVTVYQDGPLAGRPSSEERKA